MRVPDRVFGICMSLYHLHRDLAHGDDEQRRQLTRLIAEQVRFEFGRRWGTKRADPGRPPSKDAIAYLDGGNMLFAFDWQNGTTREPNPSGEMLNITGQVFIPVDPINHLAVPTHPEEPMPDPELLSRLNDLNSRIGNLERMISDLRSQVVHNGQLIYHQNYTGTITLPFVGSRTFVLRPER